MKLYSRLLILLPVILSGCATITSDTMQPLNLTTKDADGNVVSGAACALSNDKGQWESNSPSVVSVHRSAEDLRVECEKEGQIKGILVAISRAAGGMYGNIIFGGGIGALIDHSKGTGYNYPTSLPVVMGDSVVVDRRDEDKQNNPNNGSDSGIASGD